MPAYYPIKSNMTNPIWDTWQGNSWTWRASQADTIKFDLISKTNVEFVGFIHLASKALKNHWIWTPSYQLNLMLKLAQNSEIKNTKNKVPGHAHAHANSNTIMTIINQIQRFKPIQHDNFNISKNHYKIKNNRMKHSIKSSRWKNSRQENPALAWSPWRVKSQLFFLVEVGK
jgi:hypothetical protein